MERQEHECMENDTEATNEGECIRRILRGLKTECMITTAEAICERIAVSKCTGRQMHSKRTNSAGKGVGSKVAIMRQITGLAECM